MKKITTLLLVLTILVSGLFAETKAKDNEFNRGSTLGAILHMNNNKIGFGFEWGCPLTKERQEGFFSSNKLSLFFGGKDNALDEYSFWGEMLSLEEKVLLGGIINKDSLLINPYGFIGLNLGVYHRAHVGGIKLIVEIDIGGGTEVQLNKASALFAEFGTNITFVPYDSAYITNPASIVRVGYRNYL